VAASKSSSSSARRGHDEPLAPTEPGLIMLSLTRMLSMRQLRALVSETGVTLPATLNEDQVAPQLLIRGTKELADRLASSSLDFVDGVVFEANRRQVLVAVD
jgi:hypothetical protein